MKGEIKTFRRGDVAPLPELMEKLSAIDPGWLDMILPDFWKERLFGPRFNDYLYVMGVKKEIGYLNI